MSMRVVALVLIATSGAAGCGGGNQTAAPIPQLPADVAKQANYDVYVIDASCDPRSAKYFTADQVRDAADDVIALAKARKKAMRNTLRSAIVSADCHPELQERLRRYSPPDFG